VSSAFISAKTGLRYRHDAALQGDSFHGKAPHHLLSKTGLNLDGKNVEDRRASGLPLKLWDEGRIVNDP
jgi:hypothetical protein